VPTTATSNIVSAVRCLRVMDASEQFSGLPIANP
jgi:hypothetical protein